MRAVLEMTPCSRRGCGQCGQVNHKEYPILDLSKAWGKALLRHTPRAFPQAGTVHNLTLLLWLLIV